MPRQLRVQSPGAIHHVMNRGDHMGSWTYVSNLLSTKPQTPSQRRASPALPQQ